MALILKDLYLPVGYADSDIKHIVAKKLLIPHVDIAAARFVRLSLDARRKSDIHYVCSVRVQLRDAALEAKFASACGALVSIESEQERRPLQHGERPLLFRPVIVGAGPCGLFAALLLAREGYKPLLLERGQPVERRIGDVERFWADGSLNEQSNVLFGEGGAGTFSDGKLTTRIKDPRSSDVLNMLISLGAPDVIAYLAKPHIGTDKLRGIVANARKEIESLGGEYRFGTRLCGFEQENGSLRSLIVDDGEKKKIPAQVCILAIGHSARDTYRMLHETRFALSPKPFAVGVRIEHPQTVINSAQYGAQADPRLGAADYQLTADASGRGVYTFCMCPGGLVVASASESGGVVTNGMSYHARDGQNANAALLVSVSPQDFGTHPLDGIRFQRDMERAAFAAGGGGFAAPAQRVADFLARRKTTRFGGVSATYRPGVTGAALHAVLPDFVARGIAISFPVMGRQLKGFDDGDAVLTGVETRSSAPLRIERDEGCEALNMRGVYPAGEGAGYAGGIVSAAVDGLRVAQAIVERFSEKDC